MSEGLPRWLWRNYVRRHRLKLLAGILMMTAEGSMLGLMAWVVQPMFDRIFIAGDKSAIALIAGGVLLMFIIRALCGFGQRVLMTIVGKRMSADIQADVVGHLMTLDSRFFTETSPGTLIERVRGDTLAAATLPSSVFAPIVRDGVSLISLFAVALTIDWVWTLIAIAAAPVVALPAGWLQGRVRIFSTSARGAAARLSTRLDEMFHGVNPIKLAGTEKRETRRYADELEPFVKAEVTAGAAHSGIPALMDIVAGIGLLLTLTFGGLQIIDGEKSVGAFMSFFTAIALVFEPLRHLGDVSGAWASARANLDRLRQLFDLRPTILSPERPESLPVPAELADITFQDVIFGYDAETDVLHGLNFTAKAGQTTALVGPSGAGKSTVFNLLTRLAEPRAGQIAIGGLPVEKMALEDLRGLFSVVTQDTLLFDETLRDNILMGSTATEAELSDAVEAAHVADFASRLPNGLNTPAGPRGSALSGGQRQRVAIARALLRDRPILLLDEATSALDAASEIAVQDALERLSEGRTTLVIAHRLSTIRSADRIVVMDRGKVVEVGTHEELAAQGGLYAALHEMQFRGT